MNILINVIGYQIVWMVTVGGAARGIWWAGLPVLARGGRFQILEGPEKFGRFVVIEFPSLEQAVACHDSAEYVEASAFRKANGAGEVELVIVDGGDATVV